MARQCGNVYPELKIHEHKSIRNSDEELERRGSATCVNVVLLRSDSFRNFWSKWERKTKNCFSCCFIPVLGSFHINNIDLVFFIT